MGTGLRIGWATRLTHREGWKGLTGRWKHERDITTMQAIMVAGGEVAFMAC